MESATQSRAVRVLHVGCGPSKLAGAIGLDVNPASSADVIHDLEHFPYPFQDDEFDEIVCEHVLEHLTNLIRVMEELHRITRPGGRIRVTCPYFSSIYFYRDPTHRTFFTAHTFDYFLPSSPLQQFHYSWAQFGLQAVEFPPPAGASRFKRRLYALLNRHIDFYEKFLAFVLPRHTIYYELIVLKPTQSCTSD